MIFLLIVSIERRMLIMFKKRYFIHDHYEARRWALNIKLSPRRRDVSVLLNFHKKEKSHFQCLGLSIQSIWIFLIAFFVKHSFYSMWIDYNFYLFCVIWVLFNNAYPILTRCCSSKVPEISLLHSLVRWKLKHMLYKLRISRTFPNIRWT